VADSPLWADLGNAFMAAAAFGLDIVNALADVCTAIGSGLTFPALVPLLLAGAAFRMLPDCYKEPIYDLLVTMAMGAVSLFLAPVAEELPELAAVMQPCIVGTLDGLMALSAEEKETLLNRFAEMIHLGTLNDLVVGILAGIIEGVVMEIVGILMLIKAINDFLWGLVTLPMTLLSAGIMALIEGIDAAGDHHFQTEPLAQEPPDTEGTDIPLADAEPTSFRETFATLLPNLQDSLKGLFATASEALVRGLLWALDNPFTLGRVLGKTVGVLVIEILLTKGLAALAAKLAQGGSLLAKALRWVDKGVDALIAGVGKLLTFAGEIVQGALGILRSVPIPGIDKFAQWIDDAWRAFVRWVDDLLHWLKKRTRPRGDDEDDADPLTRDARRQADRARDDIGDRINRSFVTRSAIEGWLERFDRGRNSSRDGVRYDYDLTESNDDWFVRATARGDGGRKSATSRPGWLATEGRTKHYGDENRHDEDEKRIDDFFDDLQRRYPDIVGDGGGLDELENEATRLDQRIEGELEYTQMDMDWTVLEHDRASGDVRIKAVIAPNEARDTETIRASGTAKPTFDEVFNDATRKYLDDRLDEDWAESAQRTANDASLGWAWSQAKDLTNGRNAVRTTLQGWYEDPNRRESSQSWEARMVEKLRENKWAFSEPTLRQAERQLNALKSNPGNESMQVLVSDRTARLTLRMSGGPHPDLVAAIRTASHEGERGIVGFLLAMADGQTVGQMSSTEFRGSGEKGWLYRNTASNKLDNKTYVKDEFRGAAPGRHEWIPCEQIISITNGANEPGQSAQGAEWVRMQHKLRTDTGNLVYKPTRSADVDRILGEILTSSGGDVGQITRLIASRGVRADDLDLAGHVGALYLEIDGQRKGRTGGSTNFHDAITAVWSFSKDIDVYKEDLLEQVDALLWDGRLEQVILPSFVPHASLVPSEYEGKAGSAWGSSLAALSQTVKSKYRTVQREINSA
jgi:hypothetical protein